MHKSINLTHCYFNFLCGGAGMPIYEYYCERCDKVMEIEQNINDAPLSLCPECGANSFKRLISVTSFILKGGGWYSDGYTKGNKRTSESFKEKESSSEKEGVKER